MGALPKRRISKGRRNRRRAQDGLSAPALAVCPKCKKAKRPHFVCQYCGYYGGEVKKEVVKSEVKKTAAKASTKKVEKK